MNLLKKVILFFCFTTFILSCTQKYTKNEASFYSELKNNYRNYAEYKKNNYDWKAVRIFDKKADSIESGKVLNPEDDFMGLKSFQLYSTNVRYSEIKDYKERIDILFDIENIKEKHPKELADIQFFYDCWIVEESLYERYSQISRCKENFVKNLALMEDKLIKVSDEQKKYFDGTLDGKVAYKNTFNSKKTYVVYFNFDSSAINQGATKSIEKFLKDYSLLPDKENYNVYITGHADRVGKKAYNKRLSKRRADTVKHYLIKNGIDASLIRLAYMSEVDPRIITSDGSKEYANRRVTITVNHKK